MVVIMVLPLIEFIDISQESPSAVASTMLSKRMPTASISSYSDIAELSIGDVMVNFENSKNNTKRCYSRRKTAVHAGGIEK